MRCCCCCCCCCCIVVVVVGGVVVAVAVVAVAVAAAVVAAAAATHGAPCHKQQNTIHSNFMTRHLLKTNHERNKRKTAFWGANNEVVSMVS